MTLSAAINAATARLREAGIPTARLDAEVLAAKALGIRRIDTLLRADTLLCEDDEVMLNGYLNRRSRREPLQYITRVQEFMGLTFHVTPDVLIPRSETETIVEAVVERCALIPVRDAAPLDIVDVGTGCGAIAVSLAHYLPAARIVATDVSPAALTVAQQNAQELGVADRVRFVRGDLLEPFITEGSVLEPAAASFDAVVCNLPYIPTGEMENLQPEVRCFEPRLALDGGNDGLELYRRLSSQALRCMKAGAFLACEVGIGQATDFVDCLRHAGFARFEVVQDLAHVDRVVVAWP